MNTLETAKKYEERIMALQRQLHRHPELGMQEKETTGLIKSELDALRIELVDLGLETGAAGLLRGGGGPLTALRADIDAIKQLEAEDMPVRSEIDGVMHGCGHDVHTAGLLGCAMVLSELRDSLRGDVLFVFQPSEETLKGAKYLHDHGLFSSFNPQAVFGLHNLPALPVGSVGVKAGPLMSFKDGFRIRYKGKSGHTSSPQNNIDPTVAIADLIISLQTVVSRNVGPLENAVLTVCSVNSGEPFTTTINDAEITGNIRTLEPEVRERVLEHVREIAAGVAAAYGCGCETEIFEITPAVINSAALLPAARAAAEAVVGAEHVLVPSVNMASEDFSILSRGFPSFFYFLGSGIPGGENRPWHDPRFRAAPATPVFGAALLAQAVFSFQQSMLNLPAEDRAFGKAKGEQDEKPNQSF